VADSRVSDYANLLVERCVDVQPGWEVIVLGSAQARPLVEEVVRAIGRRGAVPIVQLSFSGMDFWPFETTWSETAPAELVAVRLEHAQRRVHDPRGVLGPGAGPGLEPHELPLDLCT